MKTKSTMYVYYAFVAFVFALATTLDVAKNGIPLPEPEAVQLESVIDGDTIKVVHKNATHTVRLLGIDAPEKNGPYTTAECYANEATEALQKILTNTTITLHTSAKGQQQDQYGRLLRYVHVAEQDVAEILLKEGWVYPYPKYTHDRKNEYAQFAQYATEEHIGVWQACSDAARE